MFSQYPATRCDEQTRATMFSSAYPAVLSAAAAAALAAGCAVGPRWHAPAAPKGAAYSPRDLPSETVSAEVAGGASQRFVEGKNLPFEWWTQFQSPVLTARVARALSANPGVAAAQAALRQAQEIVAAQRGFFYPSIGSTFQAERHKVSGNTNSSQTVGVQGNGTNLLPALPESPQSLLTFPHNLPSYYTFYTAELTVGFVPDVLGGNRRQVESLAAQQEAQRFEVEATYITLASNVVAASIQEASIHAQILATERIIAAQEKSLRILRGQFDSGYAMRIDVAIQEAALAAIAATLPPLQARFEQTQDMLRALQGGLPNAQQEAIELDALRLPEELPLSLPGKIIEQRPDVRAAEAQLHGANANVGVAVAAMLPDFSISGQYGGNATKINQLFAAGGPFWSVYGDVTQPVFQGGALLHQKRAASAALREAAAQYRTTVITAYQNVADALHCSMSDAETLAADVDAERSARVTYELTQHQLSLGYVAPLVLLTAQTAYEQTVLTRVQAQAARYGDTVALFQALGGGWWNRQEMAAQ